MRPVKLTDHIYWVGAIDWDLRNFHGYLTQRGSTYNAYLIIDEKITLIDSVKHSFKGEMLERISMITDPANIDYIVCNHVEMDHSGALADIMELTPDAEIYASAPKGVEGLKRHFKKEWQFKPVKSGDTLSLGKNTLHFIQTPMVHWPDNMLSYMPETGILFSNDAFGQHYASPERFDDESPEEIIFREAEKYYANIVLPYSKQVQKALNQASDLDISCIAPSHGIIWRKNVKKIFTSYNQWASDQTEPKACIVYDTMWGSTKMIAETLRRGFEEKDIRTKMLSVQTNHISDIITEIHSCRYLCVGSPTLNNNYLPTIAAFLCYLKGLVPKTHNIQAMAFGSYGWGGGGAKHIEEDLKQAGLNFFMETVKIPYIPDPEDLKEIKDKLLNSF